VILLLGERLKHYSQALERFAGHVGNPMAEMKKGPSGHPKKFAWRASIILKRIPFRHR